MSTKPLEIIKWALLDEIETRLGGTNKIKPSESMENNGTLDGLATLQHFNWLFNRLGFWSVFLNEMVEITDGAGLNLTKDEHFSIIFAFDSTDMNNYIFGFADKPDANAANTKIINNNVLTFGTTTAGGNVPISGALPENIKAVSLNFKIG